MESSIQGSESIERVRVDLESVLVELESVHRRILPRNTFELAKFGFLRPICRDPCMESSIQGSESIERVRVDLESILVELESVHRRILPRNTFELAKFWFLRPICRDPCMESSIQGSESIERVRVDLESVLIELESVHRRILPSNTKFSCFLGHFFGIIYVFCGLGDLWFWGTVPSDRACQNLPGIGRIRAGIGPWANHTKKYSNLVPGYPTLATV